MIGIYNMQPRALTIKKNKIKCILLEFPLGLKGKRVNYSQLLCFGIFIPFFTALGAGLRTPTSFTLPQRVILRQDRGWGGRWAVSLSAPPHLCLTTEGETPQCPEGGQLLNWHMGLLNRLLPKL